MRVRITPSELKGQVTPPASKSVAHRALIAAALSGGSCKVSHVTFSQDILATFSALDAMGVQMDPSPDCVRMAGWEPPSETPVFIDCRESGSTLRFIIPVCAALGIEAKFLGRGKLPERPLDEYIHLFNTSTLHLSRTSDAIAEVHGRLQSGTFALRGDVSSQYITGLLMALPLLPGESRLELTTPLESKPYVDLTLSVLADFGVAVEQTNMGYHIEGGQRYRVRNYSVEGDYSAAAFWLAAGCLSGPILVQGLHGESAQGDSQIVPLLGGFGASIATVEDGFSAEPAPLKGISIDARDIPDLVPVLAVLGAYAQGTTHIHSAARLRLKESDRLAAVCDCLRRMGAKITQQEDGLVIEGGRPLHGAAIDCHNDHRIAMCAAIAASRATTETILEGADCVKKSYPAFFRDFKSLGGNVDVLMG